jgi:hypothetical protein
MYLCTYVRPKDFCGSFNVSSRIPELEYGALHPATFERVVQKYPHVLFENLLAFFSVS